MPSLPDLGMWGQLLTVWGPMGMVLGWFMWRDTHQATENTKALNRLTRMIGLDLIVRPGSSSEVKRQVQQLLDELEKGAASA